MAEGFLKSFDNQLTVFSAGTIPSDAVNPYAIQVMTEIGINISEGKPESVDKYLNQSFDYVITVCGDAKETCPVFIGIVKEQLHIGFEDPADAIGTDEEITNEFRKIRDEIKADFEKWYGGIK
jgi:arsenate reductase